MERRNLLAGLLVLVLSSLLLTGTALAHKTTKKSKSGGTDPTAACVLHSLPSFMDQGYGSQASSIADIIEVECEPVLAEQTVKIASQQLYNRCDNHLSWTAIGNGSDPIIGSDDSWFVDGSGIGGVVLDNDGNATVVVWGGPSCAAGESIISAHLEVSQPGDSTSTPFTILPPKTTAPGVFAWPASNVEVGEYSNAATIIGVEFASNYSEKPVAISDEELYSHCEGNLQWVGPDEEYLGYGEGVTTHLDNDGNAFVVALGGPSCASGETETEASLEKAPYTTYGGKYTVMPPEPTY
jgi:hypothetical protein